MNKINLAQTSRHTNLRPWVLAWLCCSTFVVHAQTTRYWIGWGTNASTKRWSVAANWSPSGAPVGGDSLVFGHTVPLTDRNPNANQGSIAISSITFTNDGYTLGAQASTDKVVLGAGGITVSPVVTGIENNGVRFLTELSAPASIVNHSTSAGLTFRPANVYSTSVSIDNKGHLLTVGGAGSVTFVAEAGITGSGGLVKNDSGTLTLASANTYLGPTAVNGGRLQVNNVTGSGTGAGSVTVNLGGTLGGFGSIAGDTFIQNGGTLAPGSSPGSLTINADLSLDSGAILAYELNGGNQTVGGGINDLVTGIVDFTLDGTLNVAETVPGSFLSAQLGDKWRLFDYSGTLTDNGLALGTMPSLSNGWLFDVDTASGGQVNLVVVVPEPAAGALLLLGVLMTLARSGKRHPATPGGRD